MLEDELERAEADQSASEEVKTSLRDAETENALLRGEVGDWKTRLDVALGENEELQRERDVLLEDKRHFETKVREGVVSESAGEEKTAALKGEVERTRRELEKVSERTREQEARSLTAFYKYSYFFKRR